MANRLALELIVAENPMLKGLERAQAGIDRFADSAGSLGQSLGRGVNPAMDAFAGLAKGGAAAAGVIAGGFAAAATAAVMLTTSVGKQMESLEQLSQKTGIALQTIQSWSVIMGENDFHAESLTTAMRTLSKQVTDAKNPASQAAVAFEEMGLSLADLGSTETVIRKIADQFAQMADGPEKSRLAIELLGKSGLELIPILNKGAAAFDASRHEAERFGLVLSGQQVAALTAADDAMDRMSSALDGLKTRLALAFAGPVTTSINLLTEGIAKLTNITSHFAEELEKVKQAHPIISGLAPGLSSMMAIVNASKLPPSVPPPPQVQQDAHVSTGAAAAGERQEELGRKIVAQLIAKQKMILAEQRAQEALGRVLLQIHQRELSDLNKELDAYFETERRLSVITDEEQKGHQIVLAGVDAWKKRNDQLHMAVDRARVVDEAQQALFQTEQGMFGASEAARRTRLELIEAEGALQKQVIEETIFDQEKKFAAIMNLETQLDTRRRQAIQSFPTFFEQQMQAIVQSNAFSVAQITTSWTSGIANAAVKGGDFFKHAWQSTQVAVLQGFLNFGVQKAAMLALQASVELGIVSATAASSLAINTSKNAALIAGDATAAGVLTTIWTAASTVILATFGTIFAGVQTFFISTIIPLLIKMGTVVMTFLAGIASAMTSSVFGAPFSVPVWAAVALVGGAIAAIAAFAFADGGIATGPTMGLIGEAGSSEAVIPLNKRGAAFMRQAMGGGMGGGQAIHTHVYLDKREIALAVSDAQPSALRRMGLPA